MALADTARLLASLELQDKMTPGVKSALGSLGLLEKKTGTLGQAVSRMGTGLAVGARNIALLGVAVAGAVATQVAAGINILAKWQTLQAQTEAVIKSTGAAAGVSATQVKAWSMRRQRRRRVRHRLGLRRHPQQHPLQTVRPRRRDRRRARPRAAVDDRRRARPQPVLLMRWFEQLLWNSRYAVLIAVIACVLISLLLFVTVTIEAFELPAHLGAFVDPSLADAPRARMYSDGIASIAKVIDGYLFATIMLIFAMGLYELFIGRIAVAENNPIADRILLIGSIDDLKDRLAKVVFLILIVTYFEYALRGTYDTTHDLLSLAAGIALVSASIWLTSRAKR